MAVLLNSGDFDDINTSSRQLAATLDARAALAMEAGCGVLGWRYPRLDPTNQEAVHRRAAERLAAHHPKPSSTGRRFCSPPPDGHADTH